MSVYIIFDYDCSGFYQKMFQTNLSVPGSDSRNKNKLYFFVANLSCFQRFVSISSVKIFVYQIISSILGMTGCNLKFSHINNLFLVLCFLYLALYFLKIKFQQRCIWFVLHWWLISNSFYSSTEHLSLIHRIHVIAVLNF